MCIACGPCIHCTRRDTFSFTLAGSESLLTQALLTGNFEQAVELCLHEGRMADAVILANADGPTLLQRTMKRYFKQSTGSTSAVSARSIALTFGDDADLILHVFIYHVALIQTLLGKSFITWLVYCNLATHFL